MDYLEMHLEEQIEIAKEAISENERLILDYSNYVVKFSESDPDTADDYRFWVQHHKTMLVYAQEYLEIMQARLSERMKA